MLSAEERRDAIEKIKLVKEGMLKPRLNWVCSRTGEDMMIGYEVSDFPTSTICFVCGDFHRFDNCDVYVDFVKIEESENVFP